MKIMSLVFAILLSFSTAQAGPFTAGSFDVANYQGSFDLANVYSNLQVWNLDANGDPVGPTMVYYGAMLDQNENMVSCLALAFFKGNDATEIQYVHKMWGLAPGSSDCDYGNLKGFVGNSGKCIMDPGGNTRDMTPNILSGIKPFLNNPGIFARVVDLDYTRQRNDGSFRAAAPRAGLIKECKHPAVHKGLVAQKGNYHKSGRLGAGLHYAVIHQVDGEMRFTMRSSRVSKNPNTGRYDIPNNRIYTVRLKNAVDTSVPGATYPGGIN